MRGFLLTKSESPSRCPYRRHASLSQPDLQCGNRRSQSRGKYIGYAFEMETRLTLWVMTDLGALSGGATKPKQVVGQDAFVVRLWRPCLRGREQRPGAWSIYEH